MWISSAVYLKLREELAAAHARNEGLAVANRALEATMDWLRVQVTQIGSERAVLMSNYMGINVPTPIISRGTPKMDESPFHSAPHFHDVGDEEAARLGIEWDGSGEVRYTKQN